MMTGIFTSRARFLVGICIIAAIASGWWILQTKSKQKSVSVVIYLVDTLRADRLGTYGYSKRATSPEIDDIARNSVVFEEAYAPAPWTLPSVASLITSTFLCEHQIFSGRQRLNASFDTLPELLQEAGYFTGGAYSNLWVGPGHGLAGGYENFIFTGGDDQRHAPEVLDLLQQAGDSPFYFYLHTMEPHDAHATLPEYIQQFGHVSVGDRLAYKQTHERYIALKEADWEAHQALGTTDNTALQLEAISFFRRHDEDLNLLYDASVRRADDNLGEVIDLLKETGAWDSTIFVFLSDHGEEIGEHGGWFHDQSVYEELIHVPLIIHFPGDEFGGRRILGPVSLIDVMPTIFDYLGRPELCGKCRGRSLMKKLIEENPSTDDRSGVLSIRYNVRTFFEPMKSERGNVNVAIRQGSLKGIWNAEVETVELYDLSADPREQKNLGADRRESSSEIARLASAWLQSCAQNARLPEGPAQLNEESRAQLRSMGYLD